MAEIVVSNKQENITQYGKVVMKSASRCEADVLIRYAVHFKPYCIMLRRAKCKSVDYCLIVKHIVSMLRKKVMRRLEYASKTMLHE